MRSPAYPLLRSTDCPQWLTRRGCGLPLMAAAHELPADRGPPRAVTLGGGGRDVDGCRGQRYSVVYRLHSQVRERPEHGLGAP